MAEVSSARSILGGLVGPKARPQGVADGQTVDIPSPRADDCVRPGDGASRAERGAGDAASNRAVRPRAGEAGESRRATGGDSAGARPREKLPAGGRAPPNSRP